MFFISDFLRSRGCIRREGLYTSPMHNASAPATLSATRTIKVKMTDGRVCDAGSYPSYSLARAVYDGLKRLSNVSDVYILRTIA